MCQSCNTKATQFTINQDVLCRSVETANSILWLSANLESNLANAAREYRPRLPFFSSFLPDTGYLQFIPVATPHLPSILKQKAKADLERLAEQEGLMKEFLAAHGLFRYLTNDHVLNNKVPDECRELGYFYKEFFRSPKLTKALVKLFGERSPVVSYMTTKMPKTEVGRLENYRVTMSVLPHHVAGMSYYASANHGGRKWYSHGGTSCLDPLNNGDGYEIYRLVPSLKDSTLGVAYLSESHLADVWHPVYEARCLFRVCEINGHMIILLHRTYGHDQGQQLTLTEAIKDHFKDAPYTHVFTTEENYIAGLSEALTCTYDASTVWRAVAESPCYACDGEGRYDEEVDCWFCDGHGYVEEDRDCEDCGGHGAVDCEHCYEDPDCEYCGGDGTLECTGCSGEGFVNKGAICPKCDGDGGLYEEVECEDCDGEGEIYDIAEFKPYVDYPDGYSVKHWDSGQADITVSLKLLQECGAVPEENTRRLAV